MICWPRSALALTLFVALGGCSDPYASAKETVRRAMKDPDATQFRDVQWCGKANGPVRGEYNAKNSYGAYAGFKAFYYEKNAFASDFSEANYEQLYRTCFREMARHTAMMRGRPFDAKAEEASLNAVFTPPDFADPAPTPSPALRAAEQSRDDRDAVSVGELSDEEVPVCDQPDSAEKSELMNEIGTDCLGE